MIIDEEKTVNGERRTEAFRLYNTRQTQRV